MRLIDADALMQSLGITNMDCDKCAWYDKEWSCCKRGGDFENACFAIENTPTIEERKKGKWIDNTFCSECGWINEVEPGFIGSVEQFNFCPNCGYQMNGGE